MRLHLVTEHPRKPPHYDEFVRTTAQLRSEVATFAHLPDLLASHLAEILPEMCREDRARIEESF